MSASIETLSHPDTLRGYDRWSRQCDADDNPMLAATAWALDHRSLDVAGKNLLEVGCGTGRHAARLLASGAQSYVGIDGSAGMLEMARRRVTDDRCRWVQADIACFDAGASAFDLVLMVLVLEHLRNLTPTFESIRRALRPGGQLRIVEIHPDLVQAGTVAHFQSPTGEVRFTSFAHPIQAIRGELADAGFELGRVLELGAQGPLGSAVPRLAKHAGCYVLLDVEATLRGQ